MAQRPPNAAGGGIASGARLTDFGSLDLTVVDFAEGGMGLVVWGPNALRGGQMEALKLLQPARVASTPTPEARARIERQFEEEALVWCHLWPHLCVITAMALTRLPGLGDLPVLELEYAPNGSLRDRLKRARAQRQRLALRATLAWALHIAAALAHMHQRDPVHDRPAPLVHCDLKPENVLLNQNGWALLTDLGLTRAYAALDAATTPASVSAGTSAGTSGATGAPVDHQALVAQLRAQLQGEGLLPGGTATAASVAPDTATLFATRTLVLPPTRTLRPTARLDGDAGAAVVAAAAPEATVNEEEDQIGAGVAGTPPYMAPEQWRGLARTVPATDVYALGALLYELFAGYDTPAPFPRDPRPYGTAELYLQANQMGYNPLFLAWHAAHTDPAYRRGERGQGQHRLSDPDAREAALRTGPCAGLALADGSGAAGRRRAESCLAVVDALVERCLAYTPSARPTAAEVVAALQALVVETCGLEPVPVPQPLAATPQNESAFWGNLGVTYHNLGRREEELAALRRALTHAPEDPANWMNLGAALRRVGEDAGRAGAAARARGEAGETERLAGQARRSYEEALEAYQQAEARITPEALAEFPALRAALANNTANALATLDRYGEAVAADERALALQPDAHDTHFNLALHLARWSQAAEATATERVERLESAQRAIRAVLAAAPEMSDGRGLADLIARALADPQHRFQG